MLDTLGKAEIFGEMALIDDSPRLAMAIAKTDCLLAAIGQEQFKRLVANNPQFALEVMGVMAERLRQS